ncbi:LysR family transcriptional regulator [Vibrio maerlii]|uniref:LysR family transcriptional regulator n=1 Tax=Vibrio maerlii TaxID=2231648 RepID=UPI000E3EC16F|nr:LysR family transcriptional regulator [Vibrio maerlii]
MDFKKLRTFQCAAQTLNFSEASNLLGYVQSAVTNQIKALENELNTQLFERNGRGVALTNSGEQLLHYTQKLFAMRDEARAVVSQSEVISPIRIGGHETIITYYLPHLLKAYSSLHPNVRFLVQPTPVVNLKNDVLSDSIDVAFILEKPFHRQGLHVHTYQTEDIVVVCAPTHSLANQDQIHIEQLANEHLLLTEKGCCYRHQLEHQLIKAGVLNSSNISEFISIETIKQCAKLDMGIAALSATSVQEELNSGELIALDIVNVHLSSNTHCVYSLQNEWNPQVKSFIEFCTQYQFN